MWLTSLFSLRRSGSPPTRSRRRPISTGLAVEALDGRILPSALPLLGHPGPIGAIGIVNNSPSPAIVATSAQTVAYHVQDGVFQVLASHGSDATAHVEGDLYLGDDGPVHFTADFHARHTGNNIEATPTLVFDDAEGSALTIYYELKWNKDTALFEGAWTVTSGTGQFADASGGGTLSYPFSRTGPFFMDGTLTL
jgi:hypothetical protein